MLSGELPLLPIAYFISVFNNNITKLNFDSCLVTLQLIQAFVSGTEFQQFERLLQAFGIVDYTQPLLSYIVLCLAFVFLCMCCVGGWVGGWVCAWVFFLFFCVPPNKPYFTKYIANNNIRGTIDERLRNCTGLQMLSMLGIYKIYVSCVFFVSVKTMYVCVRVWVCPFLCFSAETGFVFLDLQIQRIMDSCTHMETHGNTWKHVKTVY